ncbi:MAG: diadenylate cyclase [Methanoregulaceae archaeon]|nr:diadenylate cyclase [Methanoregulaceae archaeon]
MHLERIVGTGLLLITAVVCITLLALPAVVIAEVQVNNSSGLQANTSSFQENTSLPTTQGLTVTTAPKNTIVATNPPPTLILGTPQVENLSSTMYGTATPGSGNVTLVTVRWDWGDNQMPEFHGFPYSHHYSSPGTYTLTITAMQSDGQNITKTTNISVVQPAIPSALSTTINTSAAGAQAGPPGMIAGGPVLTLLEPVIDRKNVTLNGNLNPGSPGATIESVSVDWNDGNITKSTDLPVTHQYAAVGIFTISITGNQSDNQSITKRLTLDLRDETPGTTGSLGIPPRPVQSVPPPDETPVYLIILVTVITVVATVAIVQLIIHRRRGSPHRQDIPRAFVQRAGPIPDTLPSQKEMEIICSGTDVTPEVLDPVIRTAMEIAREGREGQAIGTSFVIGDTDNVLKHSKQFVLNPFHGYHEEKRQITDPGIRGNIKEFAQLDGAFLVSGSGVVEAAGRCITVDLSQVDLPGGLGSRHSSVAGITQVTRSIGVVVSQSGGMISVFKDGKIVYTINS